MKKIFSILILIIMVSFPVIVKADEKKEDITIYLFRGKTCSHCEEALTYINNHKSEIPEGIKFLTYEIWENSNNNKLHSEVATVLNVEDNYKDSVPFFVVGSKYNVGYGGSSDWKTLIEYAKDYQTNGEYEDVVKSIIKELNIDVKSMSLDQLFSEPSKTVTIVVYSIFGLAVLGFVCMIIFSRNR